MKKAISNRDCFFFLFLKLFLDKFLPNDKKSFYGFP